MELGVLEGGVRVTEGVLNSGRVVSAWLCLLNDSLINNSLHCVP